MLVVFHVSVRLAGMERIRRLSATSAVMRSNGFIYSKAKSYASVAFWTKCRRWKFKRGHGNYPETMTPGRADVTSELLAVFYHGGKEKTMFKAINKLICIMLLMLAIGGASSGHFLTAGLLAAWPLFVGIVSLTDDIRRHGV